MTDLRAPNPGALGHSPGAVPETRKLEAPGTCSEPRSMSTQGVAT